MDYNEIKELIHTIDSSSLREFELTIGQIKIRMSKNNGPMAPLPHLADLDEEAPKREIVEKIASEPVECTAEGTIVESPLVGTFYSARGPEFPPFVEKGSAVKKGDVLCVVEAMKIMNEIVSPCDGKIEEIFAANEDLVEYHQPLFRIV